MAGIHGLCLRLFSPHYPCLWAVFVGRITSMVDKFCMCCADVSSGIENLLNSIVHRDQSQMHHTHQQQQLLSSSFVPSPYSSTPQEPGAAAVGVTRGSFIRSSVSSAGEGSSLAVTCGSATRAPPQSILKQPTASMHCDVTANSSVPVMAADSQGSISTGGTSINAKSLQRTMPQGADLNDLISRVLAGKSAMPHIATPIRKSSLVSAHLGPSPTADVTRSTSLRQPTKADTEDWLPLRHGFATQLNLNTLPLPVEAHFQRIPVASPMTVTSNPVPHSGAPSPGRVTPPTYHPPPTYNHAANVEQSVYMTPPQSQHQHSNHFGPAQHPQHDTVWPSPLSVPSHGDHRPYFDYLASEISGNSSVQLELATNSMYHLVPVPHPDTLELVPAQATQLPQPDSEMVSVAAGKVIAPPSYHVAKPLKMSTVSMTPANTRRYFEDIEPTQQARFSNQSNCISALATPTSMDCTNGDGHVSYSATPLRMTNGQHEPMANGPISYMCTPSMKPAGVAAVTHAATAPVSRQVSD